MEMFKLFTSRRSVEVCEVCSETSVDLRQSVPKPFFPTAFPVLWFTASAPQPEEGPLSPQWCSRVASARLACCGEDSSSQSTARDEYATLLAAGVALLYKNYYDGDNFPVLSLPATAPLVWTCPQQVGFPQQGWVASSIVTEAAFALAASIIDKLERLTEVLWFDNDGQSSIITRLCVATKTHVVQLKALVLIDERFTSGCVLFTTEWCEAVEGVLNAICWFRGCLAHLPKHVQALERATAAAGTLRPEDIEVLSQEVIDQLIAVLACANCAAEEATILLQKLKYGLPILTAYTVHVYHATKQLIALFVCSSTIVEQLPEEMKEMEIPVEKQKLFVPKVAALLKYTSTLAESILDGTQDARRVLPGLLTGVQLTRGALQAAEVTESVCETLIKGLLAAKDLRDTVREDLPSVQPVVGTPLVVIKKG